MKKSSDLEILFELQLRELNFPYLVKKEYKFHPKRRWRFDFAIPSIKLALEVEGGVFSRGRHIRPTGFIKDCEKYNNAVLLGWHVLRFPGNTVEDGTAKKFVSEYLETKR